jgi:hypothetical protein
VDGKKRPCAPCATGTPHAGRSVEEEVTTTWGVEEVEEEEEEVEEVEVGVLTWANPAPHTSADALEPASRSSAASEYGLYSAVSSGW